MKRHILIITSFLFSLNAFAFSPPFFELGSETGNGGDLVYCENNIPFRFELLDFYEADTLVDGFVLDLGGVELTVAQKVQIYMDRLKKVSPTRALKYKDVYESFFAKVLWLRGQELEDVSDSNHLTLPRDCKIRQLALQLNDDRVPGKKYIINEDLWDELSNNQKAGLILHEIIYEEALKNGHKDSVETRKMNSWIASRSFSVVTNDQFNTYLTKINFPTYKMIPSYDDLYLKDHNYNRDGSLACATVSHPSSILIAGRKIDISVGTGVCFDKNEIIESLHKSGNIFPNGYKLNIQGTEFISSGVSNEFVYFYSDGIPKSIYSDTYTTMAINTLYGQIPIFYGPIRDNNSYSKYNLLLNENGTIMQAKLLQNILLKLPVSNNLLELTSLISFYDNGQFAGGYIAKDTAFSYGEGKINAKSGEFSMYPNGILKSVVTNDILPLKKNNQSVDVSWDIEFDQNGNVNSGFVMPGQAIVVSGVTLPLVEGSQLKFSNSNNNRYTFEHDKYEFLISDHKLICSVDEDNGLSIFDDFSLSDCGLYRGSNISLFGKQYQLAKFGKGNSFIEFYPSMKIKSVSIEDQIISVPVRGKWIKADGWRGIRLFESGGVSDITITEDYQFETKDGRVVYKKARMYASFDEEGFLIK